jgi:hypothetical protein
MAKLVPEGRRVRVAEGGTSVIHEAAPGGMKKLRCPGTHQLAVPQHLSDGRSVLRTPNGTTYVTKRLGRS